MKKLILFITASFLFNIPVCFSQDFKAMLTKNFIAFESTQDLSQKLEYSNKLGLISKKWPDEWITHYYNAYSKAFLSYQETDEAKRDAYLDEAERERDEAITILRKENDETYVLAAMIANARIAVKPQSRWQKYGKVFEENLGKAKELNSNNPRIYHLQGISKFHTPKMFGGGKKAALPYFEKAEALFSKESNDDITRPFWGKGANDYFLKLAKGEEKE
jgi:hypothetical protein